MKRETDELDRDKLNRAVWFGQGAAVLGLIGEVRRTDFAALLNGSRELRG